MEQAINYNERDDNFLVNLTYMRSRKVESFVFGLKRPGMSVMNVNLFQTSK